MNLDYWRLAEATGNDRMKILFALVLLFSGSDTIDWFEARCAEIENIDENAVVKKTRSVQDGTAAITIIDSKLGKLEKLNCSSSGDVFNNYSISYYRKGSFIFAQHATLNLYLFQKGVRQEGEPTHELVEFRRFYETKQSGFVLNRKIQYVNESEIDSIRGVLATMDFDTVPINQGDYSKTLKSYKRIKSMR